MGASDIAENAIANSIFGKTSTFGALASAPTLHLAICVTQPADSDVDLTSKETTYGTYVRKQTGASDWNASAAGVITNATELAFPAAADSGGTVQWAAICDASTTGNMLFHGSLGSSLTISAGVTPKFEIGDISFTVT